MQLTLALGAESLLVLETIDSTEMGDSQSPYGVIFRVDMVVPVVVEVKLSHKMRGLQKHESKTTPAALGKYYQLRKWSFLKLAYYSSRE